MISRALTETLACNQRNAPDAPLDLLDMPRDRIRARHDLCTALHSTAVNREVKGVPLRGRTRAANDMAEPAWDELPLLVLLAVHLVSNDAGAVRPAHVYGCPTVGVREDVERRPQVEPPQAHR